MDGLDRKCCDAARPSGFGLDLRRQSNEQHGQIFDREEKWGTIKQNGSLRVLRCEMSLWARARTSWAKFMLPFSFASHYQRRVLRWKALISSARRGRRHKVHTRAQNMVAVIIMAQMGSLPCLILYFELHGGRKYAEHLTSAYKTATLSPQMSRTVKNGVRDLRFYI